MQSLNELRRTASRVLAASVLQVFPGTLLVEGREHLSGFYYDFIFPFEFQKDFIVLIEEKMRQVVKSGSIIKTLEMIPNNAADFLDHHQQPIRAEMALESETALVELVQIDDFVDFCESPYLVNLNKLAAFRLYDFSSLAKIEGKQITRILGTAFLDAKELKDYFRENSRKKLLLDHVQLGKDMDLFSLHENEEGKFWKWHPKGEILKEILWDIWKKEHKGFSSFFTPPQIPFSPQDITESHLGFLLSRKEMAFPYKIAEKAFFIEENPKLFYEGLLSSQGYLSDVAHVFCEEEFLLQECISSLQFMRKFSKLFTFVKTWTLVPSSHGKNTAHWKRQLEILKEALRLSEIDYLVDAQRKLKNGPELHLSVKDGMGREWGISYLRLECHSLEKVGFQGALLVRSLFSSMERLAALLLEHYQGWLPFWLMPEQVRVICFKEQISYALEIQQSLENSGYRVHLNAGDKPLKDKVQEALQEHVAYAIVIGKREEDSRSLLVNALNSQKEERMSIESLLEELQKESKFES